MITKIIIFTLLLGFSLSLTHQQSTTQPSLFDVKTQLNTLQAQTQANIQKAETVTPKTQLTKFLQDSLLQQFQSLGQLEQKVIPTIQLSPQRCSDITDSQRKILLQKIDCALGKLKTVVSQVSENSTMRASVQQDLYKRASLQYLFLQQIKHGLQMKCQVAKVVGPTVYFSNLNASNWVYGTKVTNQDFFAAYTKLVEQGKSVTVCGPQAPYVKSGTSQCFNCKQLNQVFDMSLQACIKCPGDSKLDEKTHTCSCPCQCYLNNNGQCIQKAKLFVNGNFLNVVGKTESSVTQYQRKIAKAQQNVQTALGLCSSSQNSVLSGCVSCPAGTYFLVDQLKCVSCQNLDSQTKVCSKYSVLETQPKVQTKRSQ